MCPCCKSPDFSVIGCPKLDAKAKSIVKCDYKILQCLICKYYYVFPKISFSRKEWEVLYDNKYFEKQTKWHIKKRKKERINRLNKLQYYSDIKIERFLDVGCGEGFVLLQADQMGWEAYGLDIVDNRVGDAKLIKNFKNCDLIDANYPDNYFDCIYLDSILEHITNPKEYIKEISRILKKVGVIYIGVPNEDSLLNTVKKLRNMLLNRSYYSPKIKPFITPYHVGGFNRFSIKYLLINENFSICKLSNFATRAVFLLTRFPSKQFLLYLGLTIISSIAFIIRWESYLGVYARKINN